MTHTVLSGWRFRALLLSVALSAAGYLMFSLWGGWQEVVAAMVRVGFAGTAIALTLSLVNYGLRFVRWQKFLALLGHRVHTPESLRIYIGGFGLTILPGKSGEAIRSLFLKHQAYPIRRVWRPIFRISSPISSAYCCWSPSDCGCIRRPSRWS